MIVAPLPPGVRFHYCQPGCTEGKLRPQAANSSFGDRAPSQGSSWPLASSSCVGGRPRPVAAWLLHPTLFLQGTNPVFCATPPTLLLDLFPSPPDVSAPSRATSALPPLWAHTWWVLREETPSRRLCSGSCLHRLIHAGPRSTLELRWSPCLTRDPRGWGSPGWSGVPPSPACSVLQPRAQHPFPQRAALYRLAHGSLSVLCWESGRGWPPLSLSSQGGQETPHLPTKDGHLVRTHGWSRLQTTKHQAQRILSGPSVAVSPAIRCPWAGC